MAPQRMKCAPILTSARNFKGWHEEIQTKLRVRGMYRVANGGFKKPSIPVSTEKRPAMASEIITAQRLLDKWKKGNAEAVRIILTSLSAPIHREFKTYTNAHRLLTALKQRYEVEQNVPVLEGLRSAISTTYPQCKDIHDYIEKMTFALDRFEKSLASGETLGDSVRIQFLLGNLGETWQTFLTTYLCTRFDKDRMTFVEVSHALIQEEMRVRAQRR